MLFFRKILGSPLRFFGFLSTLMFLLTAGWRWSDGVYQGGHWYGNLSPIGFVFISLSLYTIAYKTKDLRSKSPFLYRLVGSPMKFIAFFLILWGTLILIYLIGFIHYESLFIWFISGGILLYMADLFLSKEKGEKKKYAIVQLIAVTLVGLIFLGRYLHATAKTDFITTNKNEFVIVYEMDGYPPLPSTFFWRKTIHIPDNGILITSSSVEELPGYRKNYFDVKGNSIKMYREYNNEYCSSNKMPMSVDYFASKLLSYHIPCGQSEVQIAFQNLFDSMCKGEIKSNFRDTTLPKYRPDSRAIWCNTYKKNIESSITE